MQLRNHIFQPILYAMLLSAILFVMDIDLQHIHIKLIITVLLFVGLIFSWYEKKRMFDELTNKYETLSLILENCYKSYPDIVVCKKTDLTYTMCNEMVKNSFRLVNPDDIKNKNAYDFFDKKTADAIKEQDDYVLQSGDIATYTLFSPIAHKFYNFVSIPIKKNDKITGIITFGRDTTEEEILRGKLKENHSQLTSLVDNLPLIAYIIDFNGNYILGNENSYRFFKDGTDIENGVQVDINFVKDFINQEHKYVIEKKLIFSKDKYLKTTNGSYHWYSVRIAPWTDKDDNVKGVIVFLKNIDIIKYAQKQRDNYVATLSHDLKTPTLAQIRTIELLLKGVVGELNQEQINLLKLTLDSCNYMYSMVNTLVSTYKYESGEMVLNYDEFNILELVEQCVNELTNLIKSAEVNLKIESNINNPIVKADRIQLKRVLENLISNGLNYAYKNTTITITLEELDLDTKPKVAVRVINQSPYMDDDTMNNIFKRYVSHADKFNRVGAGLGLYLFKQIIEAHEGQIIAKSSKEDVNTFGFIINK